MQREKKLTECTDITIFRATTSGGLENHTTNIFEASVCYTFFLCKSHILMGSATLEQFCKMRYEQTGLYVNF